MRKLKKILAFAMAVMAIVCVFSVNAFAASCGVVNFYNSNGARTAWCNLYTGAVTTDSAGYKTERLYAVIEPTSSNLPSNYTLEAHVTYTYESSATNLETEAEWVCAQSTKKYVEVGTSVNSGVRSRINARARYRVEGDFKQICRNFNNNGVQRCSHITGSVTVCPFDRDDEWSSYEDLIW